MSSSLLGAALSYAAQNILVFPCLARGKEPAIAGGFHAATSNPETIRRYWRIADRNVGVATGTVSGIWILDIDGAEGETSLRAIEAQYGALPSTREVITGNGRHLWFQITGPIPSTAGRIARGLDVRGDGAYVIAPPSVHPLGRVYTWMVEPAGEPAIAPEWIVTLARKRPAPAISERAIASIRPPNRGPAAYGAVTLDRETTALADAGPGGRNHALNRASFRLHQLVAGGELDHHDVVERLVEACHRNGLIYEDGLRSVMATINSGANAGMRYPRSRSGAA